jgi:hypothetical protein
MSLFGFYLDGEHQLTTVGKTNDFLYITRCSGNRVGVLVMCVLVFTVFLYCFVYVLVYLDLFVTSVRTTATE